MHWFLIFWHLLFPVATAHTRMLDVVASSVVRIGGQRDVRMPTGQIATFEYVCTGEVIGVHRVLTAAHCLGDVITADGLPVKVLARNEDVDLMLLDTPTTKPAMPLRDATVVRRELVTGVGYGYGLSTLTVLDATVILVDRPSPFADDPTPPGITVDRSWLHGMSGGPLVDLDGQMVGILQETDGHTGYGVGTLIIRAFLLGTP